MGKEYQKVLFTHNEIPSDQQSPNTKTIIYSFSTLGFVTTKRCDYWKFRKDCFSLIFAFSFGRKIKIRNH